ncbi:hypothetical protein FHU33_4864 [Blastococcus colisei]|uniref:BNR repeat protein n=1 Tax=Blastococcus colisei TaxID=1564162 RepID=A0A543P275_9ACTN|nr:hypothetical protein [Blastococcus colisei]TQN38178.1 hypothetical protein FHU33_4864 [Blastococcus colisei]
MYRAVPSALHRPVLVTTVALLALTLAACSDGSGLESTLDERAQWTQASLPESARLAGERVSFGQTLGRSGELPWLVAGVAAEPGERDRARVWTEDGNGWRWVDLPLPEDRAAGVSAIATDGSRTWVAGWTWAAGDPVDPFLVTSTDRTSWSKAELPEAAAERAFQPGAATVVGQRLLLAGRDADLRPALVLAGEDGELVDLPAPPDGRELDGIYGMAAAGETVTVVAGASQSGRSSEPLVYSSTDGGATWAVALGPVAGPAVVHGVAVQNGVFVATGYQSDAAGTRYATAWSSPDGSTWAAEALPALDGDRDGLAPREGENFWLGAPSAGADRLVAPIATEYRLRYGIVSRDPSGSWSVAGSTTDWDVQGVGGTVAVQDDGTVLLTQSVRNAARIGELTEGGRYNPIVRELGTMDDGVNWPGFLDPDAAPALIGYTLVTEATGNGGWWQSNQLARYAVEDRSVVESPWDPAGTEQLSTLVAASNPDDAGVVIGSGSITAPDGGRESVLQGWFRTGETAPWAPATLANSGADWVQSVASVEGAWVGAGVRRADTNAGTQQRAGVWTSADGLTWAAADGPFAAAVGNSWAGGACALPGGDVLVVGGEEDGAQSRPVAWHGTAGQWHRVDQASFGDVYGDFTSCTTVDGTTVVQGTSGGRPTVWSTTDGTAFETTELGKRGEEFGTIRVVDGGFAAAGTLTADGQRGAVVWLSTDARSWRPVAVPSSRPLTGVDIMPDGDGGLLVAANSTSSPEIWLLADYGSLLTED